jgi:hypothetical protein
MAIVSLDEANTDGGIAIRGRSTAIPGSPGVGVYGVTSGGVGVIGVVAQTAEAEIEPNPVAGHNIGVKGVAPTGHGMYAGLFAGDVLVDGTLTSTVDIVLQGADCAEEFDVASDVVAEPGMVMVFDDLGALQPSHEPYDPRVAGIISGAGYYRPGLVLDRRGPSRSRAAVALLGKAYCFVDAQHAGVRVGDLLTTSPTAGHAMRAADASRAFGAVIGKALGTLLSGRGLIPVLVTLQ